MRMLKFGRRSMIVVSLMGILLWDPGVVFAQEPGSKRPFPKGIYIELTKDFYEALKAEGTGQEKVYTNDPANEYLRQIATSSRFMVETNLQILKQQERMIQMLQTLLEGKVNGKR